MLFAKVVSGHSDSYLKVKEIYAYKKTPYQTIFIGDIKGHGKTLVMDDELQSCYVDYGPYHEALVHPYKPQPNEYMMILGAGEGVSTDIALRRGWKHVTSVDIDGQSIDLIDKHLSDWNNDIYKRTDEFELIIGDALKVLKRTESNSLSYIIFDLTSQAILQNQDEWVSEIHRCLLPNGLLSFQDGNKMTPSYLNNAIRTHFGTVPVYKTMLDWRFGNVAKKDISINTPD